MKRGQRKVNFKKLLEQGSQNSSSDNVTERRQTRSSKLSKNADGMSTCLTKEDISTSSENLIKKEIKHVSPFSKGINLTRFLFRDKKSYPPEIIKHDSSSDDFETPIKKIKCAPKMSQRPQIAEKPKIQKQKPKKSSKQNKQPSIKSALFRNEKMFSEIAAQHCVAENFSPEDIQMALVISRSEVDTCNIKGDSALVELTNGSDNNEECENVVKGVGEDVRTKLRKYGFRTAAKEDYANCIAAAFCIGKRRAKTKWANKFTALTLRNPELQMKKLNEKIDAMLSHQYTSLEIAPISHELKSIEYKVKSVLLIKHSIVVPNAQLFRNVEYFTTSNDLERFFINELFPISHLPAGHLLKDWSHIPGRVVTPQRKQRKTLSEQDRKFEIFYKELENLTASQITGDTLAQPIDTLHSNVAYDKNEHVSASDKNSSPNKCQSLAALDSLCEMLAHTKDMEENKSQLEASNTSIDSLSPDRMAMSAIEKSLDICKIVTDSQTRSKSPDLFADSDSDCDDIVERNNLNNITTVENYSCDEVKTCLNAGNKKDSLSMKAHDIVDLTQDENVDEFQIPNINSKDKVHDTLQFTNRSENSFFESQNTAIETVPKTQGEALTMKLFGLEACDSDTEKFRHSNSNAIIEDQNETTDIAIDLTQSDHDMSVDEEEDDDCVVLSDDEVNYSILKANKFEEIKKRRSVHVKNASNNSSPNSSHLSQLDNAHNFSVLEFVEEPASFYLDKHYSNHDEDGIFERNTSFDFNLSGDAEPVKAQYLSIAEQMEITPKKTTENMRLMMSPKSAFKGNISGDNRNATSENYSSPVMSENNTFTNQQLSTPPNYDKYNFSTPRRFLVTPTKQTDGCDPLKAQRAEFGILESQSETFSQTPPQWQLTPTKKNTTPLTKFDSPFNISDNVVILPKNFSAQSNKFNSFLYETKKDLTHKNNLCVQSFVDEDDFDEFDRLVYGSPPSKSEKRTKASKDVQLDGVPTGFSQLLNGEISFNFSNNSNRQIETFSIQTPEKLEEVTINERVYYVRKTFESKPNFEQQTEAELLKQLYNIGVKPLKRKQAIKLLEYIYNETHPIIEQNKIETTLKSFRSDSELLVKSSKAVNATNSQLALKTQVYTKSSKPTIELTTSTKQFNFQDCKGDALLRFSQELTAELENEEFYIFQTNVTKKTQQPLLPLHIAWFNLVCSSPMLHEAILMYEPIDLQEIFLFLKTLGYRYNPKNIKNFFDRRCIIFRYDLTPPEKQKDKFKRKPKTMTKNKIQDKNIK